MNVTKGCTPDHSEQQSVHPFTLVFVGPVPSKKNAQRTGYRNNRRFYDPAIAAKIAALEAQVPSWARNLQLEHPNVVWKFYSPTLRSDRDGKHTTLLDVLQKTGVIRNDNMAHYNGVETITGEHTPEQEETVIVEIYPRQADR